MDGPGGIGCDRPPKISAVEVGIGVGLVVNVALRRRPGITVWAVVVAEPVHAIRGDLDKRLFVGEGSFVLPVAWIGSFLVVVFLRSDNQGVSEYDEVQAPRILGVVNHLVVKLDRHIVFFFQCEKLTGHPGGIVGADHAAPLPFHIARRTMEHIGGVLEVCGRGRDVVD